MSVFSLLQETKFRFWGFIPLVTLITNDTGVYSSVPYFREIVPFQTTLSSASHHLCDFNVTVFIFSI